MPAKKKPVKPDSDPSLQRVTRSRQVSEATDFPGELVDRPESSASNTSTGTVIPGSSPGPSVLSISDSSDSEIADFENSINTASTQRLNLPPPESLPPQVERDYSPTEFDTRYVITQQPN